MPIARFQMPDGRVARFEVPEGTSPEQAQSMMAAHFTQPQQTPAQQPQQAQPQEQTSAIGAFFNNMGGNIGNVVRNVEGLAGKGLEKLGAEQIGQAIQQNAEAGKELIKKQTEQYKQEHPMASAIGGIGGDVVVTAPIGGAIAAPVKLASKAVPYLERVAQALRTGGFGEQAGANALENAALKLGGGAVSGGAAGALTSPDDIGKSAVIGAAVPAGAKVLGTVAREVLGGTTGVGGRAISEALRAGKEGNKTFMQNVSGESQMTDVLDQAKSALSNIRQARGEEYRKGMAAVGQQDTPLSFAPIDKAVNDAMSIKSYKGVSTSRSTQDIQNKISDVVNEWKGLDPSQYHTAEGLDALKQSIGDLRDATQFGTPERKVADSVYHAIKGEIVKAAPDYAKTMKDYEQASSLVGEIEKALSLGNKASADTAMRKLQSLTRDNVNTNYGNRLRLAEELRTKGGEDIMPALAGQAMSSWMPRGMAKAADMGLAGMAALMNPAALAAAPLASPRLVGTAAYGAGKAAASANKLADMLRAASKSGVTNEEINAALLRAGIAGTAQ